MVERRKDCEKWRVWLSQHQNHIKRDRFFIRGVHIHHNTTPKREENTQLRAIDCYEYTYWSLMPVFFLEFVCHILSKGMWIIYSHHFFLVFDRVFMSCIRLLSDKSFSAIGSLASQRWVFPIGRMTLEKMWLHLICFDFFIAKNALFLCFGNWEGSLDRDWDV